jgi:tRNA threonylcarbamoyladenosine biosynthesis protein TsaB
MQSPDLVIDSAADDTVVALAHDGAIERELRWDAHQAQSATLLPSIDRLLREAAVAKADLAAVLVDIGPGGYASLRVGVSVAKAIAHALAIPIAGIGRLELDAWLVREVAGERHIVALHRAGRGDVAWAAYAAAGDAVREDAAPRVDPADDVMRALTAGDAVTGDVDDAMAEAARAAGAAVVRAEVHRAAALAMLGRRRIDEGLADDATALVPLYLRGPAIGPQPAR